MNDIFYPQVYLCSLHIFADLEKIFLYSLKKGSISLRFNSASGGKVFSEKTHTMMKHDSV